MTWHRPAADTGVPVKLTHLQKQFGDTLALDDVTLDVTRGEVFGYLGPNGAGKTTTLRLLMGFLRPSAGRAKIFGYDCWSDSVEVHRRVGYVGGDMALYERMTGHQLLTYLAALRGDVDLAYAESIAARLGADLDRAIRVLSSGNRQKLAIVQAFMSRADLLLLDEPTRGLDPLVQQEVHDMFREHAHRGGTVVLSSHVLSEVQETADRVALLREGSLLAVERLDDLRNSALHRVRVDFADPVTAAELMVPGIDDLRVEGTTVTCSVPRGAMDALLHRICRHRVADLECTEASLEELFLSRYGVGDRHVA